ncbi:MAG: HAD family hydrolase [Leptonema sp. (in: bacteria)]
MNSKEQILKNIKYIFFDVDGTLFSSEEMLEVVYQETIAKFFEKKNINQKLPTLSEILPYIGLPVKEIFNHLLPYLSEEEREEISQNILLELVNRIYKGEGIHYEGVEETLKYLYNKNYKIFSASNGRKAYVEAILKVNRIYDYFLEIPCIDNKNIFNKVQLVKDVIERYRLESEFCVLIGDRKSDRVAAFENQIHFIAAEYGHGSSQEREGALLRIHSIKELKNYL